MRNHHRRSIVALCCVVLAGALACKDSTAPDPNATLFNQVHGTYELSVVLDSFTYMACPPGSDNNPSRICHDTTVALNGHPLQGLVTLADTAPSTFVTSSEAMYFQVPAGTLTLISCDTCSSSTISYPADEFAVVGRDGTTFELTLEAAGFLILQGRIDNGEITGSALSATYLGSAPHSSYHGTFVAKRQP